MEKSIKTVSSQSTKQTAPLVADKNARDTNAEDSAALRSISTWVFDLDNTLYPADCNLFAQVDQRMAAFISKALKVSISHARYLQKDYYRKFGTTLSGLMQLHKIEPEPFLSYVHDIDVSIVQPAPKLAQLISNLPGRKFIYTNGSRRHAERVAQRLGVLDCFDGITDIASSRYCAKPDRKAYEQFLDFHAIQPTTAIMFDDMPHNLESPHDLGMTTVLVHSDYIDHPVQLAMKRWTETPKHIHHMTKNLLDFLKQTSAEL